MTTGNNIKIGRRREAFSQAATLVYVTLNKLKLRGGGWGAYLLLTKTSVI